MSLIVLGAVVLAIFLCKRAIDSRTQRCIFVGAIDAHSRVLAAIRANDWSAAEAHLQNAERMVSLLHADRAKLLEVNMAVLRQLIEFQRLEERLR